jgi:hypothetical protein
MTIPTEPIGSIPRPLKLLDAINRRGSSHPSLEPLYDEAFRDTIEQFEATGSPVVPRWGATKVSQLRDILRRGAAEYRTGWIQTAILVWTHSPVAAVDRWSVSLSDVWLRFSRLGNEVSACPSQAGRHFPLSPQPYVSGEESSRLLSGGIHRGFARRA